MLGAEAGSLGLRPRCRRGASACASERSRRTAAAGVPILAVSLTLSRKASRVSLVMLEAKYIEHVLVCPNAVEPIAHKERATRELHRELHRERLAPGGGAVGSAEKAFLVMVKVEEEPHKMNCSTHSRSRARMAIVGAESKWSVRYSQQPDNREQLEGILQWHARKRFVFAWRRLLRDVLEVGSG